MEKSRLYDLLGSGLMYKWREDIEKEESETWFFTRVQEAYAELEKALTPQEKLLLEKYSLAIENKLEYIDYNLKIKVLNFGIKVGQELQIAFTEDEER